MFIFRNTKKKYTFQLLQCIVKKDLRTLYDYNKRILQVLGQPDYTQEYNKLDDQINMSGVQK